MSSAYLICYGAPVPADAHQVPALIAELIDEVNAAAAGLGWAGTAFERFSSQSGVLSFDVVPGAQPATIEDLRLFREEQKRQRLAAEAKAAAEPEQGSLI